MTHSLRIGIAGLGTVGVGVIEVIQKNADLLRVRSGRTIEIVCVSARSRHKDRGVDLSAYDWVDDPVAMTMRPDIDVVVELIGGSEGVAMDVVTRALQAGKHVVTANKALLAHHGFMLAQLAEAHGVSLHYEAAVGGGIPVIKAARESFAGNNIRAVYGILNGTSNYILTQMRQTGHSFAQVLKEAQDLGYAEANPAFDIDGMDAAHKLCILSALVFGVRPDYQTIHMKGIGHITGMDIVFATELGYRIKLLAAAQYESATGEILQSVEPCLVPENSPLGLTEDVFNALMIEGDFVKNPFLTGRGAGQFPTASSVLSDVIDIARGIKIPVFGVPAVSLRSARSMNRGPMMAHYYLRLNVEDRPGVLADIAAVLRDHAIPIEGLRQPSYGRGQDQGVPIMVHTHETSYQAIAGATAALAARAFTCAEPCLLSIVDHI